jgi:RHS repeat-associated protein
VAEVDTISGDAQLQVGYYANDMARSLTRGDAEATYSLDASAGRFRTVTLNHAGGSTTRTNHYSTDGDNLAWTDEGGWYSRMITGLGGIAGTYHSQSGTIDWKITNLHGDFVATIAGTAAGLTATHESDEYGQPRAGSSAGRYGWLGAAQRAGDNPGDLITMGVRLYNPALGRFLSVDAVPGGNANPYDYCAADPNGCTDTTGMISCGGSWWSGHYYGRKSTSYAGTWSWYWKVIRYESGRTFNLRCRLSHKEVIYYKWGGTGLGAGIGAAVGAAFGNVIGAFVGGAGGAWLGSYAGAWYEANCYRYNKGVTIRGTFYHRWGKTVFYKRWWAGGGTWTVGFNYMYGWFNSPVCNT